MVKFPAGASNRFPDKVGHDSQSRFAHPQGPPILVNGNPDYSCVSNSKGSKDGLLC